MISILTEVRKGVLTRFGGDTAAVLNSLAASIVGALGPALRARVQGRGDPAGQHAKSWDTGHKNVQISPRYPGVAGKGRDTRSGARGFEDSAAFHHAMGARLGAYSVSGGMWEGLTRIVVTPTIATLQFRGRSEGQDPNTRGFRRRQLSYTIHQGGKSIAVTRAGRVGTARGLKVNNALKAATVLRQHGVNVLALTSQELEAISIGALSSIAKGIGTQLQVEWSGGLTQGSTVDEIMRRMLGTGPMVSTGV